MHRHFVLAGALALAGCGPSESELQAAALASAAAAAPKPRDENDPATHVADLKVAAKRPVAISRLIQFYEDAMTKDQNDRSGPTVKPLLVQIIRPLNETCLDPTLEPSLRSTVVKFISEVEDARAEGCMKKTLEEYKADQNEGDVQNVMRAVASMEQASLAPQVMRIFTGLAVSKPNARLISKEVAAAMLAVAGPPEEEALLKLIDAPIDAAAQANVQDQTFWQTVSVQALGNLKTKRAVRPLLKILLTPSKAPVANAALVGLVTIGKASVAPTEALLKGEDKELSDHSKAELLRDAEKGKDGKIPAAVEKAAEGAHVGVAAQVLGTLGAESSVAPLLDILKKGDAQTKVTISLVLPLMPRSKETLEAYQRTFESTRIDLEMPGGGRAKELLADASADLFDGSVAPWLAGAVNRLVGAPQDVDAVRQHALIAAMKSMRVEDVDAVEALVKLEVKGVDEAGKPTVTTVGKATENEWNLAKDLVTSCEAKLDCYLAKLVDEKTQDPANHFAGVKAAQMLGILGSDATRAAIVDAIPKITNPSVRHAALKALQALAPKGDDAAAKKLVQYLEKAEASKDEMLANQYRVFTPVAATLRARVP